MATDLRTLVAETPVEQLEAPQLLELLETCALEHERLRLIERRVHARLRRDLDGLVRAGEPLLTASEAARRLGVSVDYVRDHGATLGIARALVGLVRYDPAAVEAVRRARDPKQVG